MGSVNFHTNEIQLKIVYYGPGFAGKTTSLQCIHNLLPQATRPPLVSLATENERTLHFDFLPVQAAKVRNFDVRLQLYTVPGQIFYRATREIVLRAVDGVVFVADSQPMMSDANLTSLDDLAENLQVQALCIEEVPLVFQYNKRDLPEVMPIALMQSQLNLWEAPYFPTVAARGEGVRQALAEITAKTVRQFVSRNLLPTR